MANDANTAAELTTLKNGVTLINVPMPDNDNVGIYLIVKAGSRDETPQTAGLAHFLEHMFFKGSANRPTTEQIAGEIADLGAMVNAYTDTEEVCYYTVGAAGDVEKLAEIITDMLCHPKFDAIEMERERNVVRQELATRAANNQVWLSDNRGEAAFGGGQPMAWTAGGSDDVIRKVSRAELVAYHASFYDPTKMALVVCGGAKLSPEAAEKMLADMPAGTATPRVPAKWGQGKEYVFKQRPALDGEQPQVTMSVMLPGLPTNHPDVTALRVMSTVLGGGMAARLFLKVREREGLCYTIRSRSEDFDDAGIFSIDTLTRPEHAEKAVRLAFAELRDLAVNEISEAELHRAQATLKGATLRGLETAANRGQAAASTWRAGRAIKTPAERVADVEAITTKDVQRMAQMLVRDLPQARLAFVGPDDQGKEILAAARGERQAKGPENPGLAA